MLFTGCHPGQNLHSLNCYQCFKTAPALSLHMTVTWSRTSTASPFSALLSQILLDCCVFEPFPKDDLLLFEYHLPTEYPQQEESRLQPQTHRVCVFWGLTSFRLQSQGLQINFQVNNFQDSLKKKSISSRTTSVESQTLQMNFQVYLKNNFPCRVKVNTTQ